MATILERLKKHEEEVKEQAPEPDPYAENTEKMKKVNERRQLISNELNRCIQRLEEIDKGFTRANPEDFDKLALEFATLATKRELLAVSSQRLANEYTALVRKGSQLSVQRQKLDPREQVRRNRINQLRYYLGNELESKENKREWKRELDELLKEGNPGNETVFIPSENLPLTERASNDAGIETAFNESLEKKAYLEFQKNTLEAEKLKLKLQEQKFRNAPPVKQSNSVVLKEAKWRLQRAIAAKKGEDF